MKLFFFFHPASRAFFYLLDLGGEKEALPESRQTFEVTAAQTYGQVNLVLSRQTVFFFERVHPFIDKPIVITNPTVASTRLLLKPGLETISSQHAAHAPQRS